MEIDIRLATFEDSEFIFQLRNHKSVVKNSISGHKIDRTEHEKWLQSNFLKNDFYIFIAMIDEIRVGVCRFNPSSNQNTSEISIMLKPELTGRGIGFTFLSKCIELFKEKNENRLLARILLSNITSQKLFEKCGFKKVKEQNTYMEYLL